LLSHQVRGQAKGQALGCDGGVAFCGRPQLERPCKAAIEWRACAVGCLHQKLCCALGIAGINSPITILVDPVVPDLRGSWKREGVLVVAVPFVGAQAIAIAVDRRVLVVAWPGAVGWAVELLKAVLVLAVEKAVLIVVLAVARLHSGTQVFL